MGERRALWDMQSVNGRDRQLRVEADGDPYEMVAILCRRRGTNVFPSPLNEAARARIRSDLPWSFLGAKIALRVLAERDEVAQAEAAGAPSASTEREAPHDGK